MKKKIEYFEGWYFKHQNKGKMFSVIPGIIRNKSGQVTPFIQFVTKDNSYFIKYKKTDFAFSRNPLRIKIGDNLFSKKGIRLNINQPGLKVKGRIAYKGIRPLEKPIMGPFEKLPAMECYHGIVSRSHRLYGKIRINKQVWNFNRGIGYIETDRGKNFPVKYLWTHCHHMLPSSPCSVMAAIATVPLGPVSFRGCIAHIYYRNQEYILATYDGCRIKNLSEQGFSMIQGCHRLKVTFLDKAEKPLMAPAKGNMDRIIYESLEARIRYEFYQNDILLFHFVTTQGSMEYQMD